MDRGRLLAALADARPGPADVVYVEPRGEEYSACAQPVARKAL